MQSATLAARGHVMSDDDEQVSLACETCNAALTVPFAQIPEDAPLSVVARAFLEQHRGCSISIQVRPARQAG